MKLSTRLVLLILGCLLPILTAQVYSQINLYAERHEQLSGLVLRQAELASADISSILEGTRQLGTLAGQFPETGANNPNCADRLTALQNGLAPYRFLAVLAPASGTVSCSSAATPAGFASPPDQWLSDLSTANVVVGPVVPGTAPEAGFLPVAVPLSGSDRGGGPGVLLAALDVDWLARHLDTAMAGDTPAIARGSLIIADRNGVVVARVPDPAAWFGKTLPDWLKPSAGQDVQTVTDPDGHTLLAAYVSRASSSGGLTVIETLPLPAMTADIDHATFQDLLAIGGAAVIAVILAWVADRRIHLPADRGAVAGGPQMAGRRPERTGQPERCGIGVRGPVAVVQCHGRRAASAGDGAAAAIQLPGSPGG